MIIKLTLYIIFLIAVILFYGAEKIPLRFYFLNVFITFLIIISLSSWTNRYDLDLLQVLMFQSDILRLNIQTGIIYMNIILTAFGIVVHIFKSDAVDKEEQGSIPN